MKYSKEQKDVLTTLFAHNPEVEVLYLTADNQAFTEASKADSHAQRLKDLEVITVTREGFEIGEALTTERAQEAGEGKIKSVDTIPTEVIDLEGNNKDAGAALADANAQTKATLEENSDNKVIEDDKAKAAAGAALEEKKETAKPAKASTAKADKK
ncbi:MAG: hypothetical protein EOO42_01130 [Flavobacteriales bacterium]|nr:MAG: hypothetical protein EOO42_01130 [Flavobacteriales bacterium]